MKCLSGKIMDKDAIKQQKKEGRRCSEFTVCSKILWHRHLFWASYIRYEEIKQVFIRIESGESGEFPVHEYSLVVVDQQDVEHPLHVEREASAERVMQLLKEVAPDILQGKTN